MKRLICTLVALFALSLPAFSVDTSNLELGGGYAHVTGYSGLNGFNLDAAAFFSRRIALAFNYDGVYNTSTLLTGFVTKTHQQDFLVGPRINFPGLFKNKNKEGKLIPFGELQFG